jgi:hypothetical protein
MCSRGSLPPLAPVPPAPVGGETWVCILTLPFVHGPDAVASLPGDSGLHPVRSISNIYHPPRSFLSRCRA